jgi:hypothetical protein
MIRFPRFNLQLPDRQITTQNVCHARGKKGGDEQRGMGSGISENECKKNWGKSLAARSSGRWGTGSGGVEVRFQIGGGERRGAQTKTSDGGVPKWRVLSSVAAFLLAQGAWDSLSLPLVPWHLVFVQAVGFTRQVRSQSRPRYFWTQSETEVRPCCPHLNPRGTGGPESFARLALTPCYACSRAEHPRRESSGFGGGVGDSDAHLDRLSARSLQPKRRGETRH